MDIGIIAAISDNNVIGKGKRLPWHIPNDLKHFKKLTTGYPVIMGRKTYESIGKPLKHRKNIVLSSIQIRDVDVVHSLEEAIKVSEAMGTLRAYIIGGESLYRESFKFINFMEITEVHREVEGDIYFPELDWNYWREIAREDDTDCSFVSYKRR